jgi:hypothetical protein
MGQVFRILPLAHHHYPEVTPNSKELLRMVTGTFSKVSKTMPEKPLLNNDFGYKIE